VKKQFGMQPHNSLTSLTGETRTFAEILDSEVEKVVLFYLQIQGELAAKLWDMRAKQLAKLQYFVSLDQIENLCQKYRDLGMEVLQLLEYLDLNVIALRKILRKHDRQFDLRMSHVYFDTRLGGADGSGGAAINENSQLVQLYHQEGLRAIIGTIRRGFEDLYEAKEALLVTMKATEERKNAARSLFRGEAGGIAVGGATGFGGGSRTSSFTTGGDPNELRSHLPRIPYLNRINSSTALSSNDGGGSQRNGLRASMCHASTSWLDRMASSSDVYATASSNKSPSSSYANPLALFPFFSSRVAPRTEGMTRSISDLEPLLSQITESANRVMRSQKLTLTEYLASHSAMALEMRVRDMAREDNDEEDDGWGQEVTRETSSVGLILMLFATFLYQANQYVIGPTSGMYASMLGESEAMSGLIIGLSPMAALISAVVFSAWTNYSFKSPLIVSLVFLAVGNFLYAIALQNNSVPMLFMGRLLSGLGAPRGIARRYIADYVSLEYRTLASSHFVTASAMGLAIGPLISSLTSFPSNSFTWQTGGIVLVRYEIVTAPGWIMSVLFTMAVFAVMLLFNEPLKSSPIPLKESGAIVYKDSLHRLASKTKSVSLVRSGGNTSSNSNSSRGTHSSGGSGAFRGQPFASDHNSTDSILKTPLAQSLSSSYGSLGGDLGEKMQEHIVSVEEGWLEELEYEKKGGKLSHDGFCDNNVNNNDKSAIHENATTTQSSSAEPPSKITSISTLTSVGSSLSSLPSFHGSTFSSSSSSSSSFPSIASLPAPIFSTYQYQLAPDNDFTEPPRVATKDSQKSADARAMDYNPTYHPLSILHRIMPRSTVLSLFSCLSNITAEVAVILTIYVVNKTGQEIVVSSVPTLWIGVGGGGLRESGYFMAVMGFLVLPANLVISKLTKDTEDRSVMQYLNLLTFLFLLLMLNTGLIRYSLFQYVTGSFLLFAVLNAMEGVIISLLSKLVSPELAKGTFNSGLLATEAGTLGRVIGDMSISIIASMKSDSGQILNLLYLPLICGVLLCSTVIYIYHNKLLV